MTQPELALGAEPIADPTTDPATDPTYGVGELTDALNAVLRRQFPDGVWVRGEISGWRMSGPHAYFSLVEETERGQATLSVSLFAPSLRRLTPVLARAGLRLADGLRVRVHGTLDVYPPSGRLSLKMDDVDPRFTLGDLALQRDLVLRTLAEEGLLEANRRLVVPAAPLRLGVVTSATSAAWADFHDELVRSGYSFAVQLADVRVQGDEAPGMVSRAITHLSRRREVDVIVVIRGGGARSDLVAFDHESVARAVCGSRVPVFTGLGHEIDRSIADEVAHSAWKTPTACAAALVQLVRAHVDACEQAWESIASLAESQLDTAHDHLVDTARTIATHTVASVARASDRLDHRADILVGCCERQLVAADRRVHRASTLLERRAPAALAAAERRLAALATAARLLDPAQALARGWTITRDERGTVVRDPSTLAPGSVLVTRFAVGTAISRVESVDINEGDSDAD